MTDRSMNDKLTSVYAKSEPFWFGQVISSLNYDRIVRSWPERVFELFSSAEALSRWLAPRVCADIRRGGIYVFSWGRHGKVTGEIIDLEPNELFRFVWEDSSSSESLVTVEFRGIGIKTHVRLTHELFGGSTKWEWNDGHLNEWIFFLDNLCSVAEVGIDLRADKACEEGWDWLPGSFYEN